MREVLCIGVVLAVLVWRQHQAQKEIDRQVTEITREVVAVSRELAELEVSGECSCEGKEREEAAVQQVAQPVAAGVVETENLDFYRNVIHFPETERKIGKELQLEGKHEAVLLGPSSSAVAISLIKNWTISQKIFVNDPTPTEEFTTLASSERWAKVLVHKPDVTPPQVPNLDLLWVNIYGSKGGDPVNSYPEMMELIRHWAPKLRVGSVLAVADANTKNTEPGLANLIVTQLEREVWEEGKRQIIKTTKYQYGFYKATVLTGDYTTWLWRVHREL